MNISWLLLKHSGKSNRNRLLITTFAVALGFLMVLTFVAGIHALMSRSGHTSWRSNIFASQEAKMPIKGVDPVKVTLSSYSNLDQYKDKEIYVVSMYETGDNSPQLDGLKTPKPGEYYVSQALNDIIEEHPEIDLGSRFGDTQIGVIPQQYTVAPDSLGVIRGFSKKEADNQGSYVIYNLDANDGEQQGAAILKGLVGLLAIVGAAILFVPIIVFLIIATQLGSVQRERRYASLRLIGATRRQITRIITFESTIAAVAGVVIGTLAFIALRGSMSNFKFNGLKFWPADISVPLVQYIGLVLVVLVFCVFANWWAMRRVQVSPLGVVKKSKRSKKPRFWRLIPLILGLGIYTWLSLAGRDWVNQNARSGLAIILVLVGVLLVMFGMLIAGPYITRILSSIIAKYTKNASTLIATKRIKVEFKSIFRGVSGVVLALFAGSFYIATASSLDDYQRNMVSDNGYSQIALGSAYISTHSPNKDILDKLQNQPYIKSVDKAYIMAGNAVVTNCSNIDKYTTIECPGGYKYVGINFYDTPDSKKVYGNSYREIGQQILHDNENADPKSAKTKVGGSYFVAMDSNDDIDKLRTLVRKNYTPDYNRPAFVIGGTYARQPHMEPLYKELASLAYAGMAITLLVAIISIMISTIGGILERKRSFATLRTNGMDVRQMKRTVMIESVIPLVSTSVIAAGIGVWMGYVFVGILSMSKHVSLGTSYYAIVVGSLILAIVAIYSVLPILNKTTKPEENQTE